MTAKHTAGLTASLITKGLAIPTPAVASGPAAAPASATARIERNSVSTQERKRVTTYKALTLKLDDHRYRDLKLAGLDLHRSSQEILVEALDAWLKDRARKHTALTTAAQLSSTTSSKEEDQ
jgi:hypothetical protein